MKRTLVCRSIRNRKRKGWHGVTSILAGVTGTCTLLSLVMLLIAQGPASAEDTSTPGPAQETQPQFQSEASKSEPGPAAQSSEVTERGVLGAPVPRRGSGLPTGPAPDSQPSGSTAIGDTPNTPL